jgi:hypothetical protein
MPKWSNITAKDLYKGVVKKLSLQPTKSKRSPESIYWYLLDERRTLQIPMPNIHGGSGSVSTGYLKQIRNKLRLTTRQFEDLVGCPLSSDDFEIIVREKLDL